MSWSRGHRVQAALTGCVAAAAVIAGAVGGGSGATPLAAGKVIALMRNAPLALSAYPSLQMKITAQISSGGQDITVVSNANLTPDGRSGVVSEQLPRGLGTLRLIAIGPELYGKVAAGHELETNGKHWVGLHLTGVATGSAYPGSASAYVQLLAGVGKIEDRGASKIDGAAVEHYRVFVDPQKAIAREPKQFQNPAAAAQLRALGVTTLPMDVWITPQGLPLQLKSTLNVQGASFKFTIRLHSSNKSVTLAAPPSSDVYPVTTAADFQRFLVSGYVP